MAVESKKKLSMKVFMGLIEIVYVYTFFSQFRITQNSLGLHFNTTTFSLFN